MAGYGTLIRPAPIGAGIQAVSCCGPGPGALTQDNPAAPGRAGRANCCATANPARAGAVLSAGEPQGPQAVAARRLLHP